MIIAVCAHVFFILFSKRKAKRTKTNSNSSHSEPMRQGWKKRNDPCLLVKQFNSETLHPMWGLSGFVFSIYAVSVVPFQCNVLFFVSLLSLFFPCSLLLTLPTPLPSPPPGAAFCPAQAGRRTRKLPIWPCP